MRQIRTRHLSAAALAAAASLGLAACGGSSKSPGVANLNGSNNHNAVTTTTLPKGNPTQLLDEWASCMRQNGDPNQVDPTIDANGVIHIHYGTPPPGGGGSGSAGAVKTIGGGGGPGGPGSGPCDAYLTAASTALRGGKPMQRPDPAKLIKYSECMRANGVPDFPDPNPTGGLSLQVHPGSDLDPQNATFQDASKLCTKKTGVPGIGSGTAPRGAIEATAGGGPGGGPGSGAIGNGSGGGINSGGSPSGSGSGG